jgi:Zn-dependent M16 (insulinase) family peptidase
MYEVKGKVLFSKQKFVLEMMQEILFRTKFDDYKRLKELIARIKSRLESSMTGSGHTVAMLSGMAQFSPSGYYSNLMRGYGFYELIQNLDKNFETMKESISENLEKLVHYIFTKDNLIVSYNADEEGFAEFKEPMQTFAETLQATGDGAAQRVYNPENVKKAFTSSSQVQYVARCGNYVKNGFAYTGALKVLKIIFSYDYLWTNVRVKGGAYGCMSGFYRNGDMYMVSYRDPNLSKTNRIYEEAADYIREFNVSDRDMVKYIIGTIGELDSPLNPSAKGLRSFGAYLCHTRYEDLQREREDVLNADVNSIRALAPLVEAGISQNYLCVVGNQKLINEEASMFDKIEPLFIS